MVQFPDPWRAIERALDNGQMVRVDPTLRTLVDRGWRAEMSDGQSAVLRRVGVHYEWHPID